MNQYIKKLILEAFDFNGYLNRYLNNQGEDLPDEILKTNAPIIYLCNAVTQPGETDNFTVGDHVELINKYISPRKVNAVIASNTKIDEKIIKKYSTEEQKDLVNIDYAKIAELEVELIEDDLITIEDNIIRHNSIKLSSIIFSYLMRN